MEITHILDANVIVPIFCLLFLGWGGKDFDIVMLCVCTPIQLSNQLINFHKICFEHSDIKSYPNMVLTFSYTSQYYMGYAEISEVPATSSLLNLRPLNDA
jgi:hypothetical protein